MGDRSGVRLEPGTTRNFETTFAVGRPETSSQSENQSTSFQPAEQTTSFQPAELPISFPPDVPSTSSFQPLDASTSEFQPIERPNPFQPVDPPNEFQPPEPFSSNSPVSSTDSINPTTVLAGLKPPATPTPPATAPSSGRAVLPPIGFLNPSYQPFTLEPPPAYGPQTANYGGSSTLSAAAGATQAITLNGRSSVAVVCPFCCNSILTVTTETPSPVFRRSSRSYYPYAGFLVFILILFGALMFMAGSVITLFALPLFIILILFAALYASRQQRRLADQMFPDITHSCPLCQKTLGVSSGFQFLQMTQANAQRY